MADNCSVEYARAVAITQAKIHSKYWNSDRFEQDMVWVRPRCRRFGEIWLRNFFLDTYTRFLESDLGKNLPPSVLDLIRKWTENWVAVHEYWDNKPPTLLHGDSHLGNSMEYADGTAGYFDWQCLFRGYGYRDLSYFLMSGFSIPDCKAHEREIFDLYTDTLEQNGVKVD